MKRLLLVPTVLLAGCLASGIMEQNGQFDSSRFDPAQRLSPTAFEQNATMKDTSVHEDPTLLRAGVSRSQIATAFGAPNKTSDQGGVVQDVYEFNPDGSKFVKPKVYARNIAAGVFTGGIATVVHQARIHHTGAAAYGVSADLRTGRNCAVGAEGITPAGTGRAAI